MMIRRHLVLATAFILLLAIPIFVAGVTTGLLLRPTGRVRVSLTSDGGGKAQWNPEFPAVFDGSYSARLDSTDTGGGAGIMIGPLQAIPLSQLTATSVTFWAYIFGCTVNPFSPDLLTPYVEFVLNNGITMESSYQQPVSESTAGVLLKDSPAATADSEKDRGYASSELWTLMRPRTTGPGPGWHSSMAVADPRIPDSFASDQLFSTWQSTFPTAKVVSIKIQYGYGNYACTAFVDNVTVRTVFGFATTFLIEPETASSEPSSGKPFP